MLASIGRRTIFDNPDAIITIPLIKKDVENVKIDNERLREEMKRYNSFTKWFIGIMVTLSIGLLGLALSIVLK